ncbi:unnamed protein product [Bursaphelenchus okinawaensis]|uniref:GYF domain-containing protein n=1 Tax=Bursaphelenchus okinawaensis TaxID=465554 RepID=A0A811K8W0_9BILA|nr:unnamed protein product [Bursaphelenchus okinawaensis]CAG9095266.1 unnamed protein product [Bursaphelenchus okinawaensis]
MSNSEVAQNSFNPSWMQTTAPKAPRPNGISRAAEEDTGEMVEPVFAKHRYGREDILALKPRDSKPPDGLSVCPFFVEKPLVPIILSDLNETELRLQQNINSSKALSALPRAEWPGKEGEAAGSPAHVSSNPWTVAGSNKNSSFRSNNRWTTVGGNPSSEPRGSKFPFSNRANYGSPANGEKKPKSSPWSETKRQHQTSGSDEGNGTTNGDPDISADVWGSSWRSVDTKGEKKQENTRKESQESFSRGFGRGGATPWNKVEAVWGAPDVSNLTDNTENLAIRTEPELDNSSEQQNILNSFAQQSTVDQWFYLDPSGVQRGPFETKEMQAWFSSGYFHPELQIMKPGDAAYTPLGELIKTNGALTPFIEKKRSQKLPQSPPVASTQPARNAWQSTSSSKEDSAQTKPELSIDQLRLEEKERVLQEEQRRLKEREENIKREEQERQERERKIKEREMELLRKQEEVQRFALEKEKELERKRIQVLEYEQQRREELRQFEEQRLHVIQEEQEKRRQAELDFVRQEQERQRSQMELEKVRREEEEKQQREAEFLAEEQKRRQREHELQREQAERIRREHEEELQRQQQQARAAASAAANAASSKAPWLNATKKQKVVTPDDLSNKTLLEIQMEEEKKLMKRLEEEEKQRQIEAANKKPVWSSQSTGSAWSVPKNVPQPVPIPPVKEAPKQVKAEKKKSTQKKEPSESKHEDSLTAWVIQRVRQLNSSVEPDIFATFLLSIESPNEVEDYVLTYFGENKNAKEFHQEFLAKRIELRPRRRVADKDDLSGPAAAATNIAGNNGTPVAGSTPGNSAKAKKNKKGKKVVDGLILGFRPAGDPNRLNVGEIDTTPPTPLKRR